MNSRKKEVLVVLVAIALILFLPAVMLYISFESSLTGAVVGLTVENGSNNTINRFNESLNTESGIINLNGSIPNSSFEVQPVIGDNTSYTSPTNFTIPSNNSFETPIENETVQPLPVVNQTLPGNKTVVPLPIVNESIPLVSPVNNTLNNTDPNLNRSLVLRDEFTISVLPVISRVRLNTTNMASNNTNQNLTVNVTASDTDGDSVKIIYNWLVSSSGPGKSIAVLNMPFERINNTNRANAYDYSGYVKNASITNEPGNATWNATGGYDGRGAYSFNGRNNSIVIPSHGSQNFTYNYSILLWVKMKDLVKNHAFISKRNDTNMGGGWEFYFDGANDQFAWRVGFDGTFSSVFCDKGVNVNRWTHLAIVHKGADLTIYVNSTRCTVSSALYGRHSPSQNSIKIGDTFFSGADPLNGSIDDLVIFNRSLSIEQIKSFYNHSISKNRTRMIVSNETISNQNWTVDAYPNDGFADGARVRSNSVIILVPNPAVTWVTPTQRNYTRRSSNQTFNASIKKQNIKNVKFSFDNATGKGFNVTPTNKSGHWSASYNVSRLFEGKHTVTAFANDTSGNINMTESITFILDNTPPNATWLTPINKNFSRRSSNRTFNVTVRDKNLSVQRVRFSFDNSTGTNFNITATNRSGYWSASYNVSKLAEGIHFVTIIANDTNGNRNNTIRTNFTVDYTAPRVSWTTPTNVSNYTRRSSNRTFNVSILELRYVQSVRFSFDNATGTGFNITAKNRSGYWSASYNVSKLSEGRHTVTVFANDSVGNVNNTRRITIIVDNTPPGVSITSPANNADFNSGNIAFRARVVDRNLSVQSVIFSFDNAAGASFNRTATNTSGTWNVTVTHATFVTGTHTMTVLANDTVGNYNRTQVVTFTISQPPAGDGGGDVGETPAAPAPAAPAPAAPAPAGEAGPVGPAPTVEAVAVAEAIAAAPQAPSSQSGLVVTISISNPTDRTLRLKPKLKELEVPLKNEPEIRQLLKEKPEYSACGDDVETNIEALKLLEREKVQPIYKEKYSEIFSPNGILLREVSNGFYITKSMSGVIYSGAYVCANLLKSQLLNDEEIIIGPGEKIEKDLTIRRGLTADLKKVTVSFTEVEREVLVKELDLGKKFITGTAIDFELPGNIFDIYFLVVNEQSPFNGKDPYLLEVTLNKKQSKGLLKFVRWLYDPEVVFSELFGPYDVEPGKNFLFAQQMKYNPNLYFGDYTVSMKVYLKNRVIAEDVFDITLGKS